MVIETVWKLTDARDQTYGGCQWGPGVEHTAPGDDELCTAAWIHAYRDPVLAVLMNAVHADFHSPHLWRCEAVVGADDGTKLGCTWVMTVEQMPLPEVTLGQRVRFAVLAAKQVYQDQAWQTWADRWLSGEDRSYESARAAARAAVDAGAWATGWGGAAAIWAADAAGDVREDWVAGAAADAAAVAVRAAKAVRVSKLDLVALAHQAVEEEAP